MIAFSSSKNFWKSCLSFRQFSTSRVLCFERQIQKKEQQKQEEEGQQKEEQEEERGKKENGNVEFRIGNEVRDELLRNGYAIVDHALPSSFALQLYHELLDAAMSKTHLLRVNETIVKQGQKVHRTAKKNIGEFDFSYEEVRNGLPVLNQFSSDFSLRRVLQKNVFREDKILSTQELKAQVNFGMGGCFPLHFDTHPSIDNRLLTCILYLNSGYSEERDKGQLRLYPFPKPHIDIPPLFNRMVLFSSRYCLHRVLPSSSPRICFTNWISEEDGRKQEFQQPVDPLERREEEEIWSENNQTDEMKEFVCHPLVRTLFMKVVYAEEWASSLRESHPPSPEREEMIQKHFSDVEKIRKKFSRYSKLFELESWNQLGSSSFSYF